MIVYAVVWAHGWEDGVHGVFSTEERARAWLEEYLVEGWDEPYRTHVRAKYRVQAWPVDDPASMPLIDWHAEAEAADEPSEEA